MFKLREEHLAAFREVSIEDFTYRAAAVLRHVRPAETADLDTEALVTRVRTCIDRAQVYGLEEEPHIVGFVEATLVLGDDFDRDPAQPWAREVLASPAWPAARKHWEIKIKLASLDEPKGPAEVPQAEGRS